MMAYTLGEGELGWNLGEGAKQLARCEMPHIWGRYHAKVRPSLRTAGATPSLVT